MSSIDEHTIRAALRGEGDHVSVPAPPVDHLLTGGRAAVRTRRLRVGAGLGAAVAVVGIVVGGVVAQPGFLRSERPVAPAGENRLPSPSPGVEDGTPETVADLPQGDLPGLPYTVAETIYSNGVYTDLETGNVSLHVGGNGVFATWTLQKGAAAVHLFDAPSDQRTTRLDPDAAGAPVVSVDGRFVAWPVHSVDGVRVAVWDVEGGSSVRPVAFPFTPTCCDNPFRLLGIDAEGRMYGAGGGETWMAWLGQEGPPQRVRGLDGGYLTEVTPDGVVVTATQTSKEDVPVQLLGQVAGDGTFEEELRVEGTQGTVSWDGSLLAYVDAADVVRVRDLASGDEQVMRLPVRRAGAELVWETSQTLLAEVHPEHEGRSAWVRCRADTGSCELATLLPDGASVATR